MFLAWRRPLRPSWRVDPRSLACADIAFICDCRYSCCSAMTSWMSLARTSFWANSNEFAMFCSANPIAFWPMSLALDWAALACASAVVTVFCACGHEAVDRLARLFEALLGELAHLGRNLEVPTGRWPSFSPCADCCCSVPIMARIRRLCNASGSHKCHRVDHRIKVIRELPVRIAAPRVDGEQPEPY